jgi:hypothetical protein
MDVKSCCSRCWHGVNAATAAIEVGRQKPFGEVGKFPRSAAMSNVFEEDRWYLGPRVRPGFVDLP